MRFSPLLQYLERVPGGEVSESPATVSVIVGSKVWVGVLLSVGRGVSLLISVTAAICRVGIGVGL